MSNQTQASPVQSYLPFDSLSTGKEQGKLLKICIVCKTKFFHIKYNAKYCKKCIENPKKSTELHFKKDKKCPVCGKLFRSKAFHRFKQYSNYQLGISKKKTCSQECGKILKGLNRRIEHKRICLNCKKEFITKKKQQKFCSCKCGAYADSRKRERRIIEYECAYCKKKFTSNRRNLKYCSRKCGGLGSRKRIYKNCPICNKRFYITLSHLKNNKGENAYCSKKCWYEEWGYLTKGKSRPSIVNKISGKNHYLYGKSFPENAKKKLSESLKKYYKDNPKAKKKLTDRMASQSKKNWASPEYRKKYREIRELRPNKPERTFNEMTPDIVRYTGDASWWRKLPNGSHKNPDFKITGQNKVIEIWGEYCHRKGTIYDNPKKLIKLYNQAGLQCLVIWENEVYNKKEEIIERVNKFISLDN